MVIDNRVGILSILTRLFSYKVFASYQQLLLAYIVIIAYHRKAVKSVARWLERHPDCIAVGVKFFKGCGGFNGGVVKEVGRKSPNYYITPMSIFTTF
jgi:hypothetical protein